MGASTHRGQPGCGSMERNSCWFTVDFVTLKVGHMKYDDLHPGAFFEDNFFFFTVLSNCPKFGPV